MKPTKNDTHLEELVTGSISRTVPPFDFDTWKLDHHKEIQQFKKELTTSLPEQAPESVPTGWVHRGWQWIGKTKMRRRVFGTTAVTAILALTMMAWYRAGGQVSSVAFADVVEGLRATRTVRYHAESESPEVGTRTCNVWIVEPDRARFEYVEDDPSEQNTVRIVDLAEGLILSLNPEKQTATFLSMRTDVGFSWTQIRELEPLHTLRNLRDIDETTAESLGEQEVDGVLAVGFRLVDPQHNETTDVWADVETRLPIRIERTGHRIFGAITGARKEITETEEIEALQARRDEVASRQPMSWVVITNIVFDLELDESLFSLTPPNGYREGWMRMPYASEPKALSENATEEDLLRGLRVLSEDFGGVFPSEEAFGELTQRARYGRPSERNDALLRAYMYLQRRRGQYLGHGVAFGDSEEMVAGWLLSEGPGMCRVVLGDLSVREMNKNSEEFTELTSRVRARKAALRQKESE